MQEADEIPRASGGGAPDPVSAIFPTEEDARAAMQRLRGLTGCDERCFLLSPRAVDRALAALRDTAPAPASQRRRVLLGGAGAGALVGLLLAIAAVPAEAARRVDIPFLVLGSLALTGPLIGLVMGVVWNRRFALHRSLDSVRSALRYGHWGVVALPKTSGQSDEIMRLLQEKGATGEVSGNG
jgi:hypothetical protein